MKFEIVRLSFGQETIVGEKLTLEEAANEIDRLTKEFPMDFPGKKPKFTFRPIGTL